jgi:hypothetical protein
LGGSGGATAERLPRPILLGHRETVESAMPSTSAISAAVIRGRRSASIASSRSVGSQVGRLLGAELRSSSPVSPSACHRAIHLRAERALIPAASAAGITSQPSSPMRLTSRRREFGQVRPLAWTFIRVLLALGGFSPPAFKEARMNNVVRNYS